MTVVVADTSPLNYLILIGQIDILNALYGKVLIPSEVLAELADSGAPSQVVNWIKTPPEWLQVKAVREERQDSELQNIDAGERAAVLLAQEEGDALLLIDDAAGRAEASRRGIPNTGTLGVLRAAGQRNLVDLATALKSLGATNFRVANSLIQELLLEDAERRGHPDA